MSLIWMIVGLVCFSRAPTLSAKIAPSRSALATAVLYCFRTFGTAEERPWVFRDSNLSAKQDRYLKSMLVPKGVWFAGDSFEDRARRTRSYCYLCVDKFVKLKGSTYQVRLSILDATGDPLVQREIYANLIVTARHGRFFVDRKRSSVQYGGE